MDQIVLGRLSSSITPDAPYQPNGSTNCPVHLLEISRLRFHTPALSYHPFTALGNCNFPCSNTSRSQFGFTSNKLLCLTWSCIIITHPKKLSLMQLRHSAQVTAPGVRIIVPGVRMMASGVSGMMALSLRVPLDGMTAPLDGGPHLKLLKGTLTFLSRNNSVARNQEKTGRHSLHVTSRKIRRSRRKNPQLNGNDTRVGNRQQRAIIFLESLVWLQYSNGNLNTSMGTSYYASPSSRLKYHRLGGTTVTPQDCMTHSEMSGTCVISWIPLVPLTATGKKTFSTSRTPSLILCHHHPLCLHHCPASCRTFTTTLDVMRLQLPLITLRVLNTLSCTYDFISAFIWQRQLPDLLVDLQPLIAGWISRSSVTCVTLSGTRAKMLTPFQTCNSMSLHAS